MKKNLAINKLQLNKVTISTIDQKEVTGGIIYTRPGIKTYNGCMPITDGGLNCNDIYTRPGIKTYDGCFISEAIICRD